MKRFILSATLALTMASLAAPAALAQPAPNAMANPNVGVRYEPWQFQALHERLKKRQMLEEIDAFLSPLKLKKKLTFATTSCGVVNAFYDPSTNTVNLCYEIMDYIENHAAASPDKLTQNTGVQQGLLPGVSRAEAIVGAIAGVALHETGHAVFDIQEIPRLGREEDAADMIAAFIGLQFGNDIARVVVKGMFNMTWNWHAENPSIGLGSLADVHSLSLQRGFDFVCMAYGKDPEAFKDLAQAWLPAARQPDCAREYRQAQSAFNKTFLQYVDGEQMKKVQAMQILRPSDQDM